MGVVLCTCHACEALINRRGYVYSTGPYSDLYGNVSRACVLITLSKSVSRVIRDHGCFHCMLRLPFQWQSLRRYDSSGYHMTFSPVGVHVQQSQLHVGS